jgi:hypothetical protein
LLAVPELRSGYRNKEVLRGFSVTRAARTVIKVDRLLLDHHVGGAERPHDGRIAVA